VATSALLTAKESEILHLLVNNMSNKQIGLTLDVRDETIKWHLKNLFGKLGVGSRRHAVHQARLIGLLDGL
jgi:LuxR family maltose regulon positive regulatory protein